MAARTHSQNTQSESSSAGGTHSGRRRMMSQQDGEPPRPDLVTGVSALEKAAQGGQGLQTIGLDLGILGGRNNVDEEIRRQSSSSGGLSGSGSTAGSSGSQHRTSSSHSTQYSSGSRAGSTGGSVSQTQFTTGTDNDYEDEEEYEDEYEHDKSQGNAHSTHSSYSYSYQSGSDRNDPQFKHYRRTRDVSEVHMNNPLCESTHCVNVRCVVGPLDKNTGALIALRMRLVAHTLHKVSSKMFNRINEY